MELSNRGMRLCAFFLCFSSILSPTCLTETDELDLQDMFRALGRPEQLKGWKAEGGDPCSESDEGWTGIKCFDEAIIQIILNGLELRGSLGSQLANLYSLISLDVSFNKISGEIPYGLPPNVTRLNFSFNNFSMSIPHSVSSLKDLSRMDLSHNALSGPIGDVFVGLPYLTKIDLSYNNFSGNLPRSFSSLTNLTTLYLQNNNFTGSVIYLADLQLTDLNIGHNNFSGIIPQHFQMIPNLCIEGNKFDIEAEKGRQGRQREL